MYNNEQARSPQAMEGSSSEDVSNMCLNDLCFKCHICDTKAPKTHMREHFEGEKHKLCLQIAEVALDRSRKQLSLEIPPLYELDTRTFYCDPCSAVLLTSNRTLHEKSEVHLENVQYYDVLRTFSAFYLSREEVNNSHNSHNSSRESVAIDTSPKQSLPKENKENSKVEELQAVIKDLKEATAHIQCPEGSVCGIDPNLTKALTGLKLTIDRTLQELQETIARKNSFFDKTINNLKASAEKTLHDLKESAEVKHQTDVERSKFAEEAEFEIFKFKNKLSKMNLGGKNTNKTNLPQSGNSISDDDVRKKSKKMGPSVREKMKATFGSPKPNKSEPHK